jgi:hypothetical protein
LVFLKVEVNGGFTGKRLTAKDIKDLFSEPFTETRTRLAEVKEDIWVG